MAERGDMDLTEQAGGFRIEKWRETAISCIFAG
jgi:hypothetical protein